MVEVSEGKLWFFKHGSRTGGYPKCPTLALSVLESLLKPGQRFGILLEVKADIPIDCQGIGFLVPGQADGIISNFFEADLDGGGDRGGVGGIAVPADLCDASGIGFFNKSRSEQGGEAAPLVGLADGNPYFAAVLKVVFR